VLRFVVGVGLALLFVHLNAGPATAQDKKPAEGVKEAYQKLLQKAEDEYRLMFRRPQTVPEFWTAINFEVDVGKYDVAALLLKQMLEKEPAAETDKELVKIEEVQGLSSFLRLRSIRQWSAHPLLEKEAEKNVDNLIQRLTTALEKHLGDPERIGKFIKNLDAPTVQERAYAFLQLNRSRDRAAPYLLEALRTSVGTPLHEKIKSALVRLDSDFMPPLIAMLTARDAKDAKDIDLRITLLDILKRRGEERAVPDLWQLASLPKYPAFVRERARETLAYLLRTEPAKLPAAAVALAAEGERHARHQVRYPAARLSPEERKAFDAAHPDQQPVVVWHWGQKGLTRTVLSPSQADEHYGLRYGREALEIDPTYRPAQTLFLAVTLEQAYGQELDQALLKKPAPALQRLRGEVDGDLIEAVLDRALTAGNLPVILGAVEALGERGEARLARAPGNAPPRGLVRALSYPDRRVQFAAARALLRMPNRPAPVASARVVDVLRRFVAADPVPKVLLVYTPADRSAELRKAVQEAGFQPEFAGNAKEAFEQLHRAADIDAILIHYTAPESELPYFLTQLRTDTDVGLLPVLLIAPPERLRPEDKETDVLSRQQFQNNLAQLADRHRNVWVIPEAAAATADQLKSQLENYLKLAVLPPALARTSAAGSPRPEQYARDLKAQLSAAERKQYAREALNDLRRMTTGELTGYDVLPAESAVVQALRSDDLAVTAVEVLGRLPGAEPQQRLAAIVLDPKRGKLRVPAALELNRQAQKYGLVLSQALDAGRLQQLRAIADNPAEDAALRTQVALLVGRMGMSARESGVRLYQFTPEAPAPPAPAPKEK
jgi:hypothetical protein